MAANPIQWAEIEAYRRVTLQPLSAWDARLIRRLDQAVLPILNNTGAPPQPRGEVPITDTAGVFALFRGAAARHAKPKEA